MDERLVYIRKFAAKAHGEQIRKYTGEPYIVHPIRVMETCSRFNSDISVLAAALLHDVLEDTDTSKDKIREFLNGVLETAEVSKTLKLVIELTDIYEKSAFPQWNRDKRRALEAERLAKVSPDAQTVKYADILDNCQEIVNHDPHFAPKFLTEVRHILTLMLRGDKELRRLALEKVNAELRSIGKI